MSLENLEVILTHEHTDFDALASLLAAALLFPDAMPVLPHQMNRNVQEFLALYKNQFPFVTAKELPRRQITRAILVDTRAANLPKGMQATTAYYVIDHHTNDQPVPENWQLWSEPTGANTTLLLEKLMREDRTLSPAEATLLALGIHEDTGSLSYGGTTHRDVYALAWLMEPERGVNLDVVSQFLRHPLSEAQRHLLAILIEQSEFLEIAGHTIVIAQANAPDFNDSISTLAHRLRDIHEVDAIFLVVGLGDIVQVVARSTIDDMDVGEVARALGGGGHTRAAAAPVQGSDPQAVRDRIVSLIQEKMRPAVTVRQIMSMGRPQTLTPTMTIEHAAVLMRRYGHEGFPVIEKKPDRPDAILGVLTRREADRALNHGLGDKPVRRFMQAGQVTVRPSDSIATLRKTMIESHWGQIPVVNEQGEILGIVTRTDLIKLWDETAQPDAQQEAMVKRLNNLLLPAQIALLQLLGQAVDELDFTVYVVGGFVRDLLLNTASARMQTLDMDIVIEGDAIAFAHHMQSRYGGRVVPHKTFGTAKWLLTDADHPVVIDQLQSEMGVAINANDLPGHLDFVTARTEFYTAPSVLPTVEQSSIKLDLHRRDFTINTLALCLNPDRWGELLDFYNGIADLEAGIVRVLHSLSFVDDPTRILRAVRYEQRFSFQIAPRTLELLQDALELLDRVTPARVRHEFDRILQESAPEKVLARLDEVGVLPQLHPQLTVDDWVIMRFTRLRTTVSDAFWGEYLHSDAIERLYWGILVYRLPAETDAVLQERLGLRRETQQMVAALHFLRDHCAVLADPNLRPSQVVAHLGKAQPATLALFTVICNDPQIEHIVQRYLTEWQHIHATLNGHDLQTLGLPRGPRYRTLLEAARAARLDGQIHSREEEVALVMQLAAEVDAAALRETGRQGDR